MYFYAVTMTFDRQVDVAKFEDIFIRLVLRSGVRQEWDAMRSH